VGGGNHEYRSGFDGHRDRALSRKYHGREGLILRPLAGEARMTTLYAVVFIGVFPALWILATVLDHNMRDNSGRYSPKELDEDRREPLL